MKTIISAVDFTSKGNAVAQNSIALATSCQAKLRFIHVMESLPPATEHWMQNESYDRTVCTLKQDLIDRLEKLVVNARAQGVEADCRLLFGLVSQSLLDAAAECRADLLVMGVHGHSAFHEIFGESVTRSIIKVAKIPVLLIPANLDDEIRISGELSTPTEESRFKFISQT